MKRKLDWRLRTYHIHIVFEDDHLLVIDKPAGLLVLPDRYRANLPNLYTILNEELGKAFIVHRIDKETSGLMVVAKTEEAHSVLSRQFESREVHKQYLALTVGSSTQEEGVIDLPLAESDRQAGVMRVDRKSGKASQTAFGVVERFVGYALVRAEPRTGRTHQIRVHLSEAGMPIVSDPLYGDGKPFFLSQVKRGYKPVGEEKPLLNRTALHAAELVFTHPSTGERVHFVAEMPKDMRSVLQYLRKFRS
jgi:23S rRNA pseudouridine1911/1915/1917 synthase